MTEKRFVDCNIFIYAMDGSAGYKQQVAEDLVKQCHGDVRGVISTQVLQEFYSVATRKLLVDRVRLRQAMDAMCELEVVQVDVASIYEAIDCSVLNNISFWDALIVSAARKAACSVLWTEDMNHRQVINGVRIENPFLRGKTVHEPAAAYRVRRPARSRK